ncbi:N-acetylmuramoyl-L-alanine amidase family protein [Dyadobacter luticola]|uniref:N-acetylmuramoyl-L-alanine amidase n=1 Tax=Dyadobacter luticola TaxID=1979387 RepID=A0A5R9KP46_9BACT|nr:N-acetylmuramoyl-L-alanine amidase [Dyadobacter luticola]TLU97937.1 N-acetylmuramoyl-L-alanine amidase [Dyadobacter luticola]
MNKIYVFLFLLVNVGVSGQPVTALTGKIICIDPGHGGTAATDHYRVGPSGEREEWINLRVGLMLQKMLEARGAKVIMTRTEDNEVSLLDRSKLAIENKADLFISIHHNATADSSVNFPIIYFHGNESENIASVAFGLSLGGHLRENLHHKQAELSVVSDFTIFPEAGASVLRNTYGIPAVLAEASFFTNAKEEQKLKTEAHNRKEAVAYAETIEHFFQKPIAKILPKNSKVPAIPAFKVFQEAERMTPIAKRWRQDFEEANTVFAKKDTASLRQAYDLYTRSARSFPDSYVAAKCHQRRAVILDKLGKTEEANQESQRASEFYVTLSEK